MEVMFDRVAGRDVGKDSVTVCVRTPGPRGGRRSEMRTFKTVFGFVAGDAGLADGVRGDDCGEAHTRRLIAQLERLGHTVILDPAA
jgi:hypothetical protein